VIKTDPYPDEPNIKIVLRDWEGAWPDDLVTDLYR